ncbi:MAG: hypothetical protein KAH25_00485, partial [Bacteroidales bacterium]|nr:hypothetical protein [Bacteroidales bacterium]
MKKITLMTSIFALMVGSLSAQVIITEDFEDQLASDRFFTAQNAGAVNSVDLAAKYADIPSVDGSSVNGGDYCFKVAVNTDGSSDAFAGILPLLEDNGPLTSEYTITFDVWMNYDISDGSATEYIRFGVGHSGSMGFQVKDGAETYRITDGYDFAFTTENGSGADLQLYGDMNGDDVAEDLDYGDGTEAWAYADGARAAQNGNIDDVQTLYQESYEKGDDITVTPGNRWLKVAMVVSSTGVTYYVNGVEWARIETTIPDGYPIFGYQDKYPSKSMDASFVVMDNILIEAGNTLA